MKYSIIIPYQHSEERLPLLYACLECLVSLSNNTFEICIHEVGSTRKLELTDKYKYLFTKYTGVFHRAWAINRGVKELSTGDMLVLMDADLIVTKSWIREILSCTKLSIAWGKLSFINKKGTDKYTKLKYIDKDLIEKTKSPSMGSAAGAAIIVPKDLFYQVKGIPEDFIGSWGGEDNAFWAKLKSFDNKIGRFKSEIFHLDHIPSTLRVAKIQRKVFPMFYWTKAQWEEYINMLDNSWGLSNPSINDTPSINYISSVKSPKLTFAMLSWLRYDKLINTLISLKETLTISANMVIMVQGSERLDKTQRRTIRDLADKFASSDVYFTLGNIGTGPARENLVNRALKRFHSPYINLADDDTTYTESSIESAISLLDQDMSIGVVGIRYKSSIYRLNSHLDPTTFHVVKAEKPIEYVDSTGSASAIIRRDVFNLCKIDPTYIIGEWDIDLFIQARSVGWKIVNYQDSPKMKVINDFGGCPEYNRTRVDRSGINNSVRYFKNKWGLKMAL